MRESIHDRGRPSCNVRFQSSAESSALPLGRASLSALSEESPGRMAGDASLTSSAVSETSLGTRHLHRSDSSEILRSFALPFFRSDTPPPKRATTNARMPEFVSSPFDERIRPAPDQDHPHRFVPVYFARVGARARARTRGVCTLILIFPRLVAYARFA